jgi:hypothetical protein
MYVCIWSGFFVLGYMKMLQVSKFVYVLPKYHGDQIMYVHTWKVSRVSRFMYVNGKYREYPDLCM